MTNQEAFDKMMEHLRSLKERSLDENDDVCAYNGTMCPVGALMTEEEQEKFGNVIVDVGGLLGKMTAEGHTSTLHTLNLYILRAMQNLHDTSGNWDDEGFTAEGEAKRIAHKYKLTYTKP